MILAVLAGLTGSSTASGSTPNMPLPEVFAPGVVSRGANDGAPTFSPDGRTLYFERTNGKWAAILESHLERGKWTSPILAKFSGTTSDQQPAFSPDGRYLIFVSSRSSVQQDHAGQRYVSHLYRVDKLSRGWSQSEELPATVNISDRVFKPSIAANGDLYFMADTGSGGAPRWQLFCAQRRAEGYAPAQALSFSGPEDGDVDPYVAPDQSFLIFSSNTRSTIQDGHEHLFFSRKREGRWLPVEPIRYHGDDAGADDGEAQVSPDGLWLYFTSSRVVRMARSRTREASLAALRRMDRWDNGNGNVWRIPMRSFIAVGKPLA